MTRAAVADGVTTLPELFARILTEHAERPAITEAGEVLTYRELDERSDAVSGLLRVHGVSHGDRVALRVAHSSGGWAALLGILKRGAVHVTTEPGGPGCPGGPVVRRGGASFCLTDRARKARRIPGLVVIPFADAGPHTAVHHSAPNPRLATAACVVAPSASARRASVVDHADIVAHAEAWLGDLNIPALRGQRFGYLGDVPLSAVLLSLWVGLAQGAHLVVLPPLAWLIEQGLHDELSRRGVTALVLPAAALHHVVGEGVEGFAALRLLVVEGDGPAPEAGRILVGAGFDGCLVHVVGAPGTTSYRVVRTET
ncbi:AMP-binding protein [Streptomyces sp. NBC_00443]|uniref:AMP-binding protein n=1 Tax=Streptomyces sp. NBC_00443 TaxID=2975743 RepID=UPI002E1D2A01